MIRFIGNNPDGLPQKRSQALRACEPCRKRKKRCTHNSDGENDALHSAVSSTADTLTPVSAQYSFSESGGRMDASPSRNSQTISPNAPLITSSGDTNASGESDDGQGDRFIGDLNPESIFLAATSPQTSVGPGDENVGIWIPRKALASFRRRLSSNTSSQSPGADPLLSNILLPYMQRQCQQLLPSPPNYAALHRIYLQEVHPLFPVVNLETFEANMLDDSPNQLILKQAISLAASASPRGARYLQLPNRSSEHIETGLGDSASQLVSAIRTSIDLGFVKDQVVIVQVLILLALFTQFSYQSAQSAEITARAISHAQTIGLHLDIPSSRKNYEHLTRLFCCAWALDKLNAAFQGRPTMMHEHDFGRDLKTTINAQEGCFRLLLRITSLLNEVIALYRPVLGNWRMVMAEIPSFEDLIHECDATRVSSNLLATIELFYHAVIVLSCRSKPSANGGSPVAMREIMSASSIVSIIGIEFQDQISHMPFTPYALSLSLRVFYRELRFSSKSPFTRNRARKQLLNACNLLRESFSDSFPSAMKVVELAEQTVKEMEKVYNTILLQYSSSRSNSETADQNDRSRLSGQSIANQESVRPAATDSSTISFDPSAFEGLPDLDVFEFFDSDFHLGEVDAALVDNMALNSSSTVSIQCPIQDVT